MSRLPRITQKIFGSSAGASQIGQIGSFAGGTPSYTTNLTTIQALGNFLTGMFGIVDAVNAPCIEDLNGLFFLITSQLAEIYQDGIPVWDGGTTYYTGSVVQSSGVFYVSLTNANLNNSVTDPTNWYVFRGGNFRTVTTSTNLLISDQLVRSDSSSGALVHTLPLISTTPLGCLITVKDVGSGVCGTTVQGNTSDLIDGTNLWVNTLNQYNSAVFYNNGTTWDVL